ncbi:MAG: PstS family phosphate ABC transporter substrate-binding protein [Cyanobacteria bacterium P01_H01_bin.15]
MARKMPPAAVVLGLGLFIGSCSSLNSTGQGTPVRIDGSSTVFPITEKIADDFNRNNGNSLEVAMSFSGTGGGFEKFCAGETDISNASRPISEEEIAACDDAGIRYYELPIAFDAITVVVNGQNSWAKDITTEELKTIWEPAAEGEIRRWNQVRSNWPNKPIELFGPGLDSGTYDYFAQVIVGSDTRRDFVDSEDDEILAFGVADSINSLGYFGLAYYEEHEDTLKALAIDSGSGAVAPTIENVERAQYSPLARPLFIYVNYASAQKNPAVREFVEYYLENASTLVDQVGYVPLPEEGYHIAWVNFQEGEVGTAFDGVPQPNLTIAELLRQTKRFQQVKQP